eukprot:GAHX01000886.1.p1 GENE.GAHX01000886.1~~GAHX01000886.1.p1  ORF type:complete len:169 (-),score=33.28 GAHX01000886.1:31-537(-)
MKDNNFTGQHFLVTTTLGKFEFKLYNTPSFDYKRILDTFSKKCISSYYNNLLFFRVSPLNYLQTGHVKNTGIMEPSKTKQTVRIDNDIKHSTSKELLYEKGLIVKTNNYTKDWQFTVLISPLNNFENDYIVLGKVVSGEEVLERLSLVETTKLYEPIEDIRIIEMKKL